MRGRGYHPLAHDQIASGCMKRGKTALAEVDEFLAAVLPRQRQAELALLDGDSGPRRMLWSHKDPVTILAAGRTGNGGHEVESLLDGWASTFPTGHVYGLRV